jgi:putative copper resistance protein D
VLPLLSVGVVIAAMVAVGLVALTGGAGSLVTGLTDPGLVTRYGSTAVRVLAEAASVVCVGSLLLAAFLVPPQASGTLAPDGYAALRTANVAAWAWFLTSVASVVFTAADGAGKPVSEVLDPSTLVELVDAIEQPKAWVFTALIALLLALGCRLALTWGWTTVLFFAAVAGLIPVAPATRPAAAPTTSPPTACCST